MEKGWDMKSGSRALMIRRFRAAWIMVFATKDKESPIAGVENVSKDFLSRC